MCCLHYISFYIHNLKDSTSHEPVARKILQIISFIYQFSKRILRANSFNLTWHTSCRHNSVITHVYQIMELCNWKFFFWRPKKINMLKYWNGPGSYLAFIDIAFLSNFIVSSCLILRHGLRTSSSFYKTFLLNTFMEFQWMLTLHRRGKMRTNEGWVGGGV